MLLYRGVYEGRPDHDDNERFVYIARARPREPACGDFFMRVEDVYLRINGNTTIYEVDRKRYQTKQPLSYNLWNYAGKIDHFLMENMRNVMFSMIQSRIGEESEESKESKESEESNESRESKEREKSKENEVKKQERITSQFLVYAGKYNPLCSTSAFEHFCHFIKNFVY